LKITKPNLNDIEVRPDDGDDVIDVAQEAVAGAERDSTCWTLYIDVPAGDWLSARTELQAMGFKLVGTLSQDAKTWMRMKQRIRRAV
jgi:hypothetical protein